MIVKLAVFSSDLSLLRFGLFYDSISVNGKNATLRDFDAGYLRFGGGSFFDYYLVVAKDLEHLDDPESYACGNICPQQGHSRLTGRRLEV